MKPEFWAAQIEAWLATLPHPKTRAAYRLDLQQLFEVLHESPALDQQAIRHAVATLVRQGLSASSMARKLSCWRQFFAQQVLAGNLPASPMLGIKTPRQQKRLPPSLSVDQAQRLLSPQEQGDENWLMLRDQALFELAYSSGLRLSELHHLELNDLKLDQALVYIRDSKRGKSRVVPVGRMAITALQRWLQERALHPAEGGAVFINARGKALAMRSIQQRLAQHARRAGLESHVHPHMLRHACASHLLQSSGDLRAVQELLGHQDISTTQIYTQLDFQHLAKTYDQFHPRARKKTP
jgi:integrase/recombinase XerC